MPKPGEIRYCPELGGQETNAAFVWIPPGSFWMGDKREENNPVRFVTLTKGFWLQQTPLTERQYININSDLPRAEISWYSGGDSDQPQRKISWGDVSNFCQNKDLRMPTEAEWEYAARANTGHKYLWSGSNVTDNVAWTRENSERRPHNVGQLKSNNFGIFDMSGSASEWCSDWYDNWRAGFSLTAPQVNPNRPASGPYRVLRGGNWDFDSQSAQVALFSYYGRAGRLHYIGVRLIWEPQDA